MTADCFLSCDPLPALQIESNLGDFQFLFVDLILVLALAFGSE